MKKLLVLITLILLHNIVQAQIHPADGDTVNYRIVGFKVPEKQNVTGYLLEVYETYLRDDNTMYTRFLFNQESAGNRIIATIPSFGKTYKWRVKYVTKNKITDSSKYYTFTAPHGKYTDANKYPMKVLKNELAGKDYYMFVDGTRTMYNMRGEAMWYLPDIHTIFDSNSLVRDLEITPFNTITLIAGNKGYEIDYDGNILWEAPDDGKVSGDSSEFYHHELTRLNNGNYMIIGAKPTLRQVPDKYVQHGSEEKLIKKDNKNYRLLMSATLIEYNPSGNIVWSWMSNDIFTDADLFTPGISGNGPKANTHMNAFFFNETSNVIYTSHRNINRIVKISYPSGKVLANYGEAYNKEIKISGDGLFYGQHSCRIAKNGQMYLFNNNMNYNQAPDSGKQASTVAFFKEPVQSSDTLKKVWSFPCIVDTLTKGFTQGGGGVRELQNGDLLVCMSLGRNFIVTKSKEIIWDAIIEQANSEQQSKIFPIGYRSSLIETTDALNNIIRGSKQ